MLKIGVLKNRRLFLGLRSFEKNKTCLTCLIPSQNTGIGKGLGMRKRTFDHMGMGQNPIPLVNIKIAGKWMFIPLKMVCIGIDP